MKLNKPQKMKLAKAMGLKISTVYYQDGNLITARYTPCWTVPVYNCLDRKFYCRKIDFDPAHNSIQGYDLFLALLKSKPLLISKMLGKLCFEAKTKRGLKKSFWESVCAIGLIQEREA